MHELGIVNSILHKALESYKGEIREIHIVIGELTHLDKENIEFWLKRMAKGTRAENAKIYVKLERALFKCLICGKFFRKRRPHCGSWEIEEIKGRELFIKEIK